MPFQVSPNLRSLATSSGTHLPARFPNFLVLVPWIKSVLICTQPGTSVALAREGS